MSHRPVVPLSDEFHKIIVLNELLKFILPNPCLEFNACWVTVELSLKFLNDLGNERTMSCSIRRRLTPESIRCKKIESVCVLSS